MYLQFNGCLRHYDLFLRISWLYGPNFSKFVTLYFSVKICCSFLLLHFLVISLSMISCKLSDFWFRIRCPRYAGSQLLPSVRLQFILSKTSETFYDITTSQRLLFYSLIPFLTSGLPFRRGELVICNIFKLNSVMVKTFRFCIKSLCLIFISLKAVLPDGMYLLFVLVNR